ncbi:MAG: hypothetical protein E7372_00805 [Clostridiales bacterium]|nr:hypothetical protein [Clostridiales bacterium]
MPIITEISVQKNNNKRCNVYVDGEFFCGMSIETAVKNRIKLGQEVEIEKLEQLVLESEQHEALTKATDYISKNLKTKRQVKEYLLKKGYSEQVVWHCIDKLKEYNYIDDAEYSKRYIESVSKRQGRRLTEYKLMMKGVKKEDIESAYLETEDTGNESAKLIAQKHLGNKPITKENLAKTYRYLIGKGFTYDQATYALKDYKGD